MYKVSMFYDTNLQIELSQASNFDRMAIHGRWSACTRIREVW